MAANSKNKKSGDIYPKQKEIASNVNKTIMIDYDITKEFFVGLDHVLNITLVFLITTKCCEQLKAALGLVLGPFVLEIKIFALTAASKHQVKWSVSLVGKLILDN